MATELAPGVWMWRREHPEWTPDSDYEPEVACYAVRLPSARLLIDPLWADDDADEDWIDEIAHAYGGRVVTNAAAAALLDPSATVSVLAAGEDLADGARFLDDGRGRGETPLWLPTARAVAFADAVRGDPEAGGLRVWSYPPGHDLVTRDALSTIAQLEPELVLVGHGEPIVHDGAAALREALYRPPWIVE